LEVDLKTGGATLYGEEGIFNAFGRTIIATSQPGSPNKWTITDAFVKKYNNANGTNLSKKDVQKVFTKDLAKQNNFQRAAIINNNATEEDKIRLSKESKIPRVIDPKTKKTPAATTDTPIVAETESETGDTSRPSSEPPKNEAGTRDDFGSALHYPVSRDPKQDRIKFDMLKYKPKKISGFGFGERDSTRESIGTVTLPIPGGISDSNACNWGDDTMGPLQLAAAGIALEALTPDGSTQLGGVIGDLKSQLYTNNTEMKQLIQAKASAAAVGADANSLFSRTQGMILNPNLELLFQSPTLRPFTFQFKMSPRSAAEAKVITQIIRFFKQGMAPIREESRLFLKTPHTFRIKYVQMGDNDKSIYLNKFKECALLSCSVQYTPEGNYAPYEDGAMSSYQMSLQFKELEPVYNDSYKDMPTDAIGF
jgi:hypothetical protein